MTKTMHNEACSLLLLVISRYTVDRAMYLYGNSILIFRYDISKCQKT